jgi:hypothetical protein
MSSIEPGRSVAQWRTAYSSGGMKYKEGDYETAIQYFTEVCLAVRVSKLPKLTR